MSLSTQMSGALPPRAQLLAISGPPEALAQSALTAGLNRTQGFMTSCPMCKPPAPERPWPHPDGAPHGAQVVVVGLHYKNV